MSLDPTGGNVVSTNTAVEVNLDKVLHDTNKTIQATLNVVNGTRHKRRDLGFAQNADEAREQRLHIRNSLLAASANASVASQGASLVALDKAVENMQANILVPKNQELRQTVSSTVGYDFEIKEHTLETDSLNEEEEEEEEDKDDDDDDDDENDDQEDQEEEEVEEEPISLATTEPHHDSSLGSPALSENGNTIVEQVSTPDQRAIPTSNASFPSPSVEVHRNDVEAEPPTPLHVYLQRSVPPPQAGRGVRFLGKVAEDNYSVPSIVLDNDESTITNLSSQANEDVAKDATYGPADESTLNLHMDFTSKMAKDYPHNHRRSFHLPEQHYDSVDIKGESQKNTKDEEEGFDVGQLPPVPLPFASMVRGDSETIDMVNEARKIVEEFERRASSFQNADENHSAQNHPALSIHDRIFHNARHAIDRLAEQESRLNKLAAGDDRFSVNKLTGVEETQPGCKNNSAYNVSDTQCPEVNRKANTIDEDTAHDIVEIHEAKHGDVMSPEHEAVESRVTDAVDAKTWTKKRAAEIFLQNVHHSESKSDQSGTHVRLETRNKSENVIGTSQLHQLLADVEKHLKDHIDAKLSIKSKVQNDGGHTPLTQEADYSQSDIRKSLYDRIVNNLEERLEERLLGSLENASARRRHVQNKPILQGGLVATSKSSQNVQDTSLNYVSSNVIQHGETGDSPQRELHQKQSKTNIKTRITDQRNRRRKNRKSRMHAYGILRGTFTDNEVKHKHRLRKRRSKKNLREYSQRLVKATGAKSKAGAKHSKSCPHWRPPGRAQMSVSLLAKDQPAALAKKHQKSKSQTSKGTIPRTKKTHKTKKNSMDSVNKRVDASHKNSKSRDRRPYFSKTAARNDLPRPWRLRHKNHKSKHAKTKGIQTIGLPTNATNHRYRKNLKLRKHLTMNKSATSPKAYAPRTGVVDDDSLCVSSTDFDIASTQSDGISLRTRVRQTQLEDDGHLSSLLDQHVSNLETSVQSDLLTPNGTRWCVPSKLGDQKSMAAQEISSIPALLTVVNPPASDWWKQPPPCSAKSESLQGVSKVTTSSTTTKTQDQLADNNHEYILRNEHSNDVDAAQPECYHNTTSAIQSISQPSIQTSVTNFVQSTSLCHEHAHLISENQSLTDESHFISDTSTEWVTPPVFSME